MEVGQHAVVASPRILMIGLEVVGYCMSAREDQGKTMSGVDSLLTRTKEELVNNHSSRPCGE